MAIIRLVNMYRLLYLGGKSRHHNIAYVWTAVEVNLALICSSMPALRPLFSRILPRIFGTGNSGNNNRSGEPYGISGASGNLTYGGTGSRSHHQHQGESHAMGSMFKDLNLNPARKQANTEIRGVSPSGSEEEMLTYNGILRTTNVNVMYEDAKRSDGGSNVSSDAPQTNA